MKRALAGLYSGAMVGVALAAAATIARWLTWKPYVPVHLPWDLLVCVAGAGAAFGVARITVPARARLALLAGSTLAIAFCVLKRPPSPVPPMPANSAPTTSAAPPGPGPRAGGRSVLLIVLDTLRRSNVSLHGYGRRTTPNLDRWAQGALVFDQATSVSSWTLPAHASMFTGLYPRSHGAHGYRSERQKDSTYRLPGSCETLAEIASQAGIATAAIVANHLYLAPRFGVDQGFGTYWCEPPRAGFRLPPADFLCAKLDPLGDAIVDWPYCRDTFVTDWTIDALEELRGRPFFLFVNYLDVHRPNLRAPTLETPLEDEIAIPRYFPELTRVLRGEPIADKVRRSLVNAYDRELEHLDAELGRLFRWLETSGLADDLVVIVTSDHGEYFGEHGLIDHAVHLYDEAVDVPLIVKGRGIAPGRSARPVQVVDVFPTVLEVLGLPARPSQATSLLSAGALDAPLDRPSVCEWYAASNGFLLRPEYGGRFDRDWRSIRVGPWRLLEDSRGNVELYDLASDPRETRDLARESPGIVADLRARLAEWVASHPEGEKIPVEESRERDAALRALGYVGDG